MKGEHAGEGRHLAEFLRVQVFERVEVDDDSALALGHFIGPDAMPIAGARRALDVDRPHADALAKGEIVGAVVGVDDIFGDTAAAERARHRFDGDAIAAAPCGLEEPHRAGPFEKGGNLVREVGEDRLARVRLLVLLVAEGGVER
ncbi:MAG: hypothetical protein WB760_32765 [Xanthobacteraceae bacterium]